MTPHDLFAAFLKHRLIADVGSQYPDNIPLATDNENRHKNIPVMGTRKAKAWLNQHELTDIKARVGIPFGIWHNNAARCMCMVASFHDINLVEMLWRVGKWRVSENDIAYYRKLFWDVEGWDGGDWGAYLARVEGIDFEILKDLIGDVAIEPILHKLGINQVPDSYQDILSRMAMRAYEEFEVCKSADAIQWGKFAVTVIGKLKDTGDQADIKSILKEMELEIHPSDILHSIDEGETFV